MLRTAAVFDAPSTSTTTMLSDLSANIFAALLIVLILLLQLRVAADRASPPDDLPLRTHVSLSAGEVLTMLRERGSGSPGSSFDLADAGIRTGDGTMLASSAVDDMFASTPGPVRLYIFSNRWFERVTAALAKAGRPWRDLSVPRALRARDDGAIWSPAFLALLSERRDASPFRSALARLLTATPGPLVRDGHVAASPGRSAAAGPSETTSASGGSAIRALMSAVIGCFALGSGATLVLWTEHRALRRITERERFDGRDDLHV